jgi:hypothetical protein
MPKRTVSFHYLSINREENVPMTRTARRRALTCREIEAVFVEILRTMTHLQNGARIKTVVTLYNQYFVEVIDFTQHHAFIRIGQQNPNNTYGIRDIETLEQTEVPMRANQLLELYTYCLVDFSRCIISYIGVNGAPKISALRYLFNDHFTPQEHTTAYISAIMTEDIINTIIRKDLISSFEIKVAVPSDTVLGEIGVREATFDALRNVKTRTKTIELIAKRNRNLFERNEDLNSMLADTKERFGDNLRGFEVRARNRDEEGIAYNLLHYHFTKKVDLEDERDHDTLTSETFKAALITTYEQNRNELVRYTPAIR